MKSKRVFATMVLLLICVTIASLPLVGQKTGPKYDASTEAKLKGTVQEIKEVPGAYEGVHVAFKTSGEIITLQLAPNEFLEMIGFEVKTGETLTVTGSKVTVDGVPEVLVRTIEQGENLITLRDPDGKPGWAFMKLKE